MFCSCSSFEKKNFKKFCKIFDFWTHYEISNFKSKTAKQFFEKFVVVMFCEKVLWVDSSTTSRIRLH